MTLTNVALGIILVALIALIPVGCIIQARAKKAPAESTGKQ